jgi:hypothetical protein
MTKWGHRTIEDERKNELIKARIAEIRKANPKLSFREAWYKLAAEHPDWIKSDDQGADTEEEPRGGWREERPTEVLEYVEVRQPHVSYKTPGARRPKGYRADRKDKPISTRAGGLDVVEIARQMGIPITIMASESGEEGLVLSEVHRRLLTEYMEALGCELEGAR